MGGNLDLQKAAIHLFDGEHYSKPITFAVDAAMIEEVRVGILRRLATPKFRKLEIKHLTGEIYGLQKLVFSEVVSVVGTAHYYYLDIEW